MTEQAIARLRAASTIREYHLVLYDRESDSFIGSTVRVPRWLFDDAVEELVEGGLSDEQARLRLLDEAEWVPVEGVERLPARCLQCRQPLHDSRSQFCDVVCEAGYYAEVHE